MISIEFFGSPGSGKTTIRNFLAKEFWPEFEIRFTLSNNIFTKIYPLRKVYSIWFMIFSKSEAHVDIFCGFILLVTLYKS